MKLLNAASRFLIVLGILIIWGRMEQSDFYNLSAAESIGGCLFGAALCYLGAAAHKFLAFAEKRKIKKTECRRIPFVRCSPKEPLKRRCV